MLAVFIGCFFAGMGGIVYGTYVGHLAPQTFTILQSVIIVIMVIAGGSGTIAGPILGATLLVLLPEALRVASGEWRLIIYGAIFVTIVMISPTGLMGLIRSLQRRIRK